MKEEHLKYLDNLRESGVTNMWGAASYLQEQFTDLSKKEAKHILVKWIKGFASRQERKKK